MCKFIAEYDVINDDKKADDGSHFTSNEDILSTVDTDEDKYRFLDMSITISFYKILKLLALMTLFLIKSFQCIKILNYICFS